AKVRLAKLIISDFHSAAAADEAEEEFNKRFVKKEVPDDIEEKTLSGGTYRLPDLLTATGMAGSKGEAKRLIEQGGVKIDGEKATNSSAEIDVSTDAILIQVGKRKFLKVRA